MKNFYLTLLALLTAITTNAQMELKWRATKKSQALECKKLPLKRNEVSSNHSMSVIWSDDFSDPSTWVISHDSLTSGDWVIGTNGPSGGAAIDTINSATAANGFALFDSFGNCSGNQIGNLTTAAPINLSGHPAVRLSFSQYYERYYDSTYVYVSTNQVNWTKFEVNGNLLAGDFSANNDPSVNPEILTLDISSVAGNQSTVYVRFQFYSPNTIDPVFAGCGFSWMIDDISISDIPGIDGAALTNVFQGEYSSLPLADAAGLQLQARVINTGSADITGGNITFNVIKDSILKFTNTDAFNLTLHVGDTSSNIISTNQYVPTELGLYTIQQIVSISGDPAQNNDTVYSYVWVDDSTYARDNIILDTAGSIASAGFTGFSGFLGQMYYNYQLTYATSATVYLKAPILGDNFSLSLYNVGGGLPTTAFATTSTYTITAADTLGGFITQAFPAQTMLAANTEYFLSINQLGVNNISLGANKDIYTPGKIFYNGGNGWNDVGTQSDISFLIRLNTPYYTLNNIQSTIADNDFSIYPNPSNGIFYLKNNNGLKTAKVTVMNSLGQTVKTISLNSFSLEKIDLSNQASGIYTVKLENAQGVSSQKIIMN